MVPRLMSDEQKEPCMQVGQNILEELETEPNMLSRAVTGDEAWIFEYDPLIKRHSLEWKASSQRPKKARPFKSKTSECGARNAKLGSMQMRENKEIYDQVGTAFSSFMFVQDVG